MAATVLVLVGVMVTKCIRVANGTPEEVSAAAVAEVVDKETGEWKLEGFEVQDGCVTVVVLDPMAVEAIGA